MNRRHFISAVISAAATAWLSGCGRHEPVHQPTPLTSITPKLTLKSHWQKSLGSLAYQDVSGIQIARDEGKLYVATASGQVTSLTLQGETRWTWVANRLLLSGGALSASGDKLYVGSAKGDVYALNTDSGQPVWHIRLDAEVLSVTEYAGRLFARTANGYLHALDANDGRLHWVLNRDLPALSVRGLADPIFVSNGMLLGWEDGTVELILQANGERVWETRIAIPKGRSEIERMVDVQAGLIFDGLRIYAAATQGKLTALDIQSGSTAWVSDTPTWVGMAYSDARLFVVTPDDAIKALSVESGRGLWVQDALKYRRLSQLTSWSDWVVCADMEGVLHLLSAQTGEMVGRVPQAISGRMVDALIIDDQQLCTLDTTGKLTLWQIERLG